MTADLFNRCQCGERGVGHDRSKGLSAYAIVHGGSEYPHDPDDLGRCLQVSPNAPKHMSSRSPEWSALVENWDELAALYFDEYPTGRAPKTYARMRELLTEARRTT